MYNYTQLILISTHFNQRMQWVDLNLTKKGKLVEKMMEVGAKEKSFVFTWDMSIKFHPLPPPSPTPSS